MPSSVSLLAEVVASAIKKINEAEVFTESLRNELRKYSFQQPEEESFEFTSKELTLLQLLLRLLVIVMFFLTMD